MTPIRAMLLCSALAFAAPLPAADAQPAARSKPAAAPPPLPYDAAVRELGRRWLVANDGVGLTIGVYDDGRRAFYNFGATRLDGNQPPTKDTVYEIGPLGKTMTGQLLARAFVEGRASPEDDVAKYLDGPHPNLENGGKRVRLIHLANMTSQLPDNNPDVSQVRATPGEPLAAGRMRVFERFTREEFLAHLRRVVPTRVPGTDPVHSNFASVLLGVVLEKIYGVPFEALLANEIEKPLRMASGAAPPVKLLARGYTRANEELPPFAAKMSLASASLRYSAEDLLRYAAWQLVERDASVKLAHQPTWKTPDGRQAVAFYWLVLESPHGRRLQYAGGTYGFASVCELYPEAKIAVVLLSNKAADRAQETLRALSADIVALARPGAEPRAPADGGPGTPPQKESPAPQVGAPASPPTGGS
jgi:serine-type D-Ala-D-Ala carboxypeptidase/endopeptidase